MLRNHIINYIIQQQFVIVTQRTSIALPDQLHERLQVVKDNLNVSQICQRALEMAIELEETKMKALSKKERVIERLRVEGQKSKEEWFICGKRDAFEATDNLARTYFEQIVYFYKDKDELEKYGLWVKLAHLPEDLQEIVGADMENYSPKPYEANEASYLAGWIEGVIEFWDEIKGEI